jgi:hypothetical protein
VAWRRLQDGILVKHLVVMLIFEFDVVILRKFDVSAVIKVYFLWTRISVSL